MARVRFRALRLCVCYLWVYVGVMGMQASPRPDSTTPSSLPRAIDGVSRGLFHSRLSQVDLSQVQSSQVESSRVKSSQVESSRVKSSQVEGPLDASPRACLQDRSAAARQAIAEASAAVDPPLNVPGGQAVDRRPLLQDASILIGILTGPEAAIEEGERRRRLFRQRARVTPPWSKRGGRPPVWALTGRSFGAP